MTEVIEDQSAFERHRTEKAVPYWCDSCRTTKTAKSRYVGVLGGRRTTICNACHGENRMAASA